MTTLYPELMEKVAQRVRRNPNLVINPITVPGPRVPRAGTKVKPNKTGTPETSGTAVDTDIEKAIAAYLDPGAKLEDARATRATKNEQRVRDLDMSQKFVQDKVRIR